MIIGSHFPGDDNIAVMRVQYETFGELVNFLFSYSRDRYLDAVRLIGKIDDVAVTIQAVIDFDRRALEAAHDRIAAYFRFTFPQLGLSAGGAMSSAAKEETARRWRAYFHAEARQLAQDDHVARAILKAVVLNGTETGKDYEGVLLDRLRDRYPLPEARQGTPE